MAIKSSISYPLTELAVASSDTVLFDVGTRSMITAFSIHNRTDEDREINIYISPNLTSVSGKQVETHTLGPEESYDVIPLLGQGLTPTEQVIGISVTPGALLGELNSKITYASFTGES